MNVLNVLNVLILAICYVRLHWRFDRNDSAHNIKQELDSLRAEIDTLKKDMAVANEKHAQTVSNMAAATAVGLASQDEVRAVGNSTTVARVRVMVRERVGVRMRAR